MTLTRSSTKIGKQREVPRGSRLLSPSNRTNPDFTGPLGEFDWDVAPGFYQVLASHAGCRSRAGHRRTGSTPVMSVPPPRVNLAVTLRCPRLRRAATRLTLKVVSHKGVGELLEAALSYRRHRRRIARAALVGSVGFRIGAVTQRVTLDSRHGWAIFDVPPVKAHSRIVATFPGNGLLGASRASTRVASPALRRPRPEPRPAPSAAARRGGAPPPRCPRGCAARARAGQA